MITQPSIAPLAASPDGPAAFLATALLVDDLALLPDSAVQNKLAVAAAEAVKPEAEEHASFEDLLPAVGSRGLSGITVEPQQSGGESDEEIQTDDRIHTRALVDAFADRGIVCAALAPHSTEGVGVDDPDRCRVIALAARTDIVVIDWFLRTAPHRIERTSYQRMSSRTLIKDILSQDREGGGRLRLLCVYTGNSDLDDVQRQLKELVEEVHGRDSADSPVPRVVDGPHLRIVLVAKPSNEAPGAQSVAERDLPNHLIDEFVGFADGLLRTVALTGLAAVRDNAHRLLARFEAEMDPAFLSHRALVGPTEGEQFVLGLLGDELAATLVAAKVGASLTPGRLEAAIDGLLPADATERRMLCTPTGPATVVVETDVARRLLRQGRKSAGLKDRDVQDANLVGAASVSMLCFDGDGSYARLQAEKQDLALAVLSCLARDPRLESAHQPPPVLALGSVLMLDGENPTYYLCVQPLCDSVRLTRPKPFPLLPVKSVEEGKFDLTIPNPKDSGGVLRLSSRRSRLADLQIVKFKPDKSTETVQGNPTMDNRVAWTFLATNNPGTEINYGWLGDLRPAIAMRAAAALGQSASRIGLTESEFQRVRSNL